MTYFRAWREGAMMRRLLAALLLVSIVAACATPLTPDEVMRTNELAATLDALAAPTGALVIMDQRAPEATRARLVPVGIAGGFSCFVGINQLGDEHFAADRVARLENAIAQAFPERRGQTLVVRRYDIYLNQGAEADATAMAAAMGSVGLYGGGTPDVSAEQIWRRPKCDRDRMHSGWFDSNDLTNNNAPITIEIDVSVSEQAYAINASYSPEIPLLRLGVSRLEDSPAFDAMVQRAMDRANTRLVEAMRRSTPANAAR